MTTENTYKELINIAFRVKDSSDELLNKAIQGNKQALDFLESKIGAKVAEIAELGQKVEIQKIYITPEEKEAVDRHIDEFING